MTVMDYLENTAARLPEKTAVYDPETRYTYAELLCLSRRIATASARRCGKMREGAAVITDRNAECIPAFFGIAQSGNFYVPIDAGQPLGRMRDMLEQMRPAFILDTKHLLPEETREALGIPVLDFEDAAREEEDPQLLAEIRRDLTEDDPLFAICTSGSTGIPKGVLKSHKSIGGFVPVFAETFQFTEEDVFGNQAPFDFDVSAKDIYTAVYLGATLFIIPKVCFTLPKKAVEALDDEHVTVIIWAVSALCILAGLNVFKKRVPASLKKILFSGEAMPVKMLNVWRQYLPDAMYVNLYGSTECTGNSLYYVVDRDFESGQRLPLGKNFAGQQIYFLNDKGQPAAEGETGEIYVGGPCVALGYYRDPVKSAAAFVQNPLNDRYRDIVFKSGDMAVRLPSGEYVFASRKDFQIKHMGHRIELEEIEMNIGAVEGVTRVCCLFDEEKNKIAACYSGGADKKEIIEALKLSVPKYMIPNIFIPVETLPVNDHGKIDRKKVREIYDEL